RDRVGGVGGGLLGRAEVGAGGGLAVLELGGAALGARLADRVAPAAAGGEDVGAALDRGRIRGRDADLLRPARAERRGGPAEDGERGKHAGLGGHAARKHRLMRRRMRLKAALPLLVLAAAGCGASQPVLATGGTVRLRLDEY